MGFILVILYKISSKNIFFLTQYKNKFYFLLLIFLIVYLSEDMINFSIFFLYCILIYEIIIIKNIVFFYYSLIKILKNYKTPQVPSTEIKFPHKNKK